MFFIGRKYVALADKNNCTNPRICSLIKYRNDLELLMVDPQHWQPPIRSGEIPPWHELDEYTFERLARDIYGEQPGIEYCNQYGNRGQSQHGIDLLAPCTGNDGIEVAQVKRYKKLTTALMKSASDKFFESWDKWKTENVKRFVLVVACSATDKNFQDELLLQRNRFKRYGIEYQLWDDAIIRDKLRSKRHIAHDYLPDPWVKIVCGPDTPQVAMHDSASGSQFGTRAIIDDAVGQLTAEISDATEEQYQLARRNWREGRTDETAVWIAKTKSRPSSWTALREETKAKVLRLEAGLALERGENPRIAETLADEALEIFPKDDQVRVRALIATYRRDNKDALSFLAKAKSPDDLNLKAAILLDMGRVEESIRFARRSLKKDPSHADSLRTLALGLLAVGDTQGARQKINHAAEIEPNAVAIRRARGIIFYCSCLSIGGGSIYSWPAPVDWSLLRRDDSSLADLRLARSTFGELAQLPAIERKGFRDDVWELACLANDPDYQADAAELARNLLDNDPGDHCVISWALTRSYVFDLTRSLSKLNSELQAGEIGIERLAGMVGCYVSKGDGNAAVAALEEVNFRKLDDDSREIWEYWRAQSLIVANQPKRALRLVRNSRFREALVHAEKLALNTIAVDTGDVQELERFLRKRYEAKREPVTLLELCTLVNDQKMFVQGAELVDDLVELVPNASGRRLAANILYNAHQFARCQELLRESPAYFAGNILPPDLRRLLSVCLQLEGDMPTAIEQAESLAADHPTFENLIALAHAYFAVGDQPLLISLARRLASFDDLGTEDCIRLAGTVVHANPLLAERLVRRVDLKSVPDELLGPVANLANQLGLDDVERPIIDRMYQAAISGSRDIKFLATVEDFKEVQRLEEQRAVELSTMYERGSVPIHLIAKKLNLPLAHAYHGMLAENGAEPAPGRQPFLLGRYGGRSSYVIPSVAAKKVRLNIDVTSFLLAAHLELLDSVETAFGTVRIPYDLVPALIDMRHQYSRHPVRRLESLRKIRKLVESGKIQVHESPSEIGAEIGEFGLAIGREIAEAADTARNGGGYVICKGII